MLEQIEGLDLPALAKRGESGVYEIGRGVYETERARSGRARRRCGKSTARLDPALAAALRRRAAGVQGSAARWKSRGRHGPGARDPRRQRRRRTVPAAILPISVSNRIRGLIVFAYSAAGWRYSLCVCPAERSGRRPSRLRSASYAGRCAGDEPSRATEDARPSPETETAFCVLRNRRTVAPVNRRANAFRADCGRRHWFTGSPVTGSPASRIDMPTHPLKWRSAALTDGASRAPARAMLRATGLTDEDLRRPLIGVANTWIEIGPCNYHLRELAVARQGRHPRGRRHAARVQHRLDLRRHHDGQRGHADLARQPRGHRRLDRAGRARQPVRRRWSCWSAATRRFPAAVMALARLDIPGLVLYGGSIAPGRWHDRDVTIQDVFEAVGAHAAGTHERRRTSTRSSARPVPAPAPAAASSPRTRWRRCASSSASRRSAAPACRPSTRTRSAVARAAGALVMDVLQRGLRPRQIITRDALENAIAAVAATGGSTNAVLHLLAIANEARRAARHRRLRPHQRARAAARRPQAGRPLRRDRPASRRRHSARRAAAARRRASARRRDHRHRPDDRRARARGDRKRRARRSCGRWPTRSSRPAAWSSSRATSRPKARW